jgi:hypothetical protein
MPFLEVVYADEQELSADAVERFRRTALEIFEEVCEIRPEQLRMAIHQVPLEHTLEPLRKEEP